MKGGAPRGMMVHAEAQHMTEFPAVSWRARSAATLWANPVVFCAAWMFGRGGGLGGSRSKDKAPTNQVGGRRGILSMYRV